MSYIVDLLIAVSDITASQFIEGLFLQKDGTSLVIVTVSAFLLYGLSVSLVRKSRKNESAYNKLKEQHPLLSFWTILTHIAGLIYLPIAFGIYYLTSDFYANDILVLLYFLAAPAFTLYIIISIGKDNVKPGGEFLNSKKAHYMVLFFFILVFVIFDTVFMKAGYFLCNSLQETFFNGFGEETAWYLLIPYRILFIIIYFIPMRLWLLAAQKPEKYSKLIFIFTILTILLSGLIWTPQLF